MSIVMCTSSSGLGELCRADEHKWRDEEKLREGAAIGEKDIDRKLWRNDEKWYRLRGGRYFVLDGITITMDEMAWTTDDTAQRTSIASFLSGSVERFKENTIYIFMVFVCEVSPGVWWNYFGYRDAAIIREVWINDRGIYPDNQGCSWKRIYYRAVQVWKTALQGIWCWQFGFIEWEQKQFCAGSW